MELHNNGFKTPFRVIPSAHCALIVSNSDIKFNVITYPEILNAIPTKIRLIIFFYGHVIFFSFNSKRPIRWLVLSFKDYSLKVAFFQKVGFVFLDLQISKKIYSKKTILKLKYKFPTNNSKVLLVGNLNFKLRIVFWNIFFFGDLEI